MLSRQCWNWYTYLMHATLRKLYKIASLRYDRIASSSQRILMAQVHRHRNWSHSDRQTYAENTRTVQPQAPLQTIAFFLKAVVSASSAVILSSYNYKVSRHPLARLAHLHVSSEWRIYDHLLPSHSYPGLA